MHTWTRVTSYKPVIAHQWTTISNKSQNSFAEFRCGIELNGIEYKKGLWNGIRPDQKKLHFIHIVFAYLNYKCVTFPFIAIAIVVCSLQFKMKVSWFPFLCVTSLALFSCDSWCIHIEYQWNDIKCSILVFFFSVSLVILNSVSYLPSFKRNYRISNRKKNDDDDCAIDNFDVFVRTIFEV